MRNLEELIYPLVDEFDRKFFNTLKIGIVNKYRFAGDIEDRKYFFKSLLCFQLIKDYRAPLIILSKYISESTELALVNKELKDLNFQLDFSWMVWKRDKMMGESLRQFFDKDIEIVGTDKEYDEFVLRYLVSIWLVDWEGPLFVIANLVEQGGVNLSELNKVLDMWDFTKLFKVY